MGNEEIVKKISSAVERKEREGKGRAGKNINIGLSSQQESVELLDQNKAPVWFMNS